MARFAVLPVLVLLALSGAVSAQEKPEARGPAVPKDRLPVLGTVGDYPPAAKTVVAEISPGTEGAPPRLVVEGRQLDLKTFTALLGERSREFAEKDDLILSRLHVVIRADRDVRWQDTQWLMQACADPSVRVCRILFAAMPEDGSEEGAMATYLPVDAGVGGPVSRLPVLLRRGEGGTAAPGAALYVHLRRLPPARMNPAPVAVVDALPDIATGAVLQVVDALFRAGARGAVFRGTSLGLPSRGGISLAGALGSADCPRVFVLDTFVQAPGAQDPVPPPLARVRGRFAGQAESPPGLVAESSHLDENTHIQEAGTFGGRRGGHRIQDLGGGPETEAAIQAGLEWLKTHQSPGGYWDCDGFEAMCGNHGRCGGPGSTAHDVGATGLALLAFLGYGETHKTPRYGQVVRNGLKYLKNVQDAEGCFGPRTSVNFTYGHAIAALAMAEAFGLTQSPLFKSSAQNGVNFILQSRNPGLAWRYGVQPGDDDTSVTTWMVLALKSAKGAGLDVDDEAFKGAKAWLDRVTDPETGRAGYTVRGNGPCRKVETMEKFPQTKSESLTAMAVLARLLCGAGRSDGPGVKGADLCMRTLPRGDDPEAVDFVYWHFGTLAMFQVGGEPWEKWNAAMKEAVLGMQRRGDGDGAHGSWDPVDPWASEGGRVYSTALNVMNLEVYYRYARMAGPK